MAAVGGCCWRAELPAPDDAEVLVSAAPIAAVGGCWPVVAVVPPTVGPAPASRDASSFVIFSISVVHGPAQAAPDKATMAHATSSNVPVFMSAFSRLRLWTTRGLRRFTISTEKMT
jgi:hypothetical protein